MHTQPILTLARDIQADLVRDIHGPGVLRLLRDYARAHDDWKDYAFFNEHENLYARNLVARTDLFEMLVLCWKPGQASPVHNHEGQNCWMAILRGAIEEAYFEFPDGNGRLRSKGEPQRYTVGTAGYIHDEIGLHLIRPAAEKRSISLHLYSLPFDECNIYCPDTGKVTRAKLGYYTVDRAPANAP